jgi:hypothetical protein
MRADRIGRALGRRTACVLPQRIGPEASGIRVEPQDELGSALLDPPGQTITERFDRRRGRVRPLRLGGQAGDAPVR